MEIIIIVLLLCLVAMGYALIKAKHRNAYLFNALVTEQINVGALQDNLHSHISNEELMVLLHDIIRMLYDDPDAQITINTERALLTTRGHVYLITAQGISETQEWVILRGKPARLKHRSTK